MTKGGHVVQIVGFISNEDMTFGPLTSNVGGGGYFVIRNSWGCNVADAGYWYIPADYARDRFTSLEAMEFDARRSQRWSDDQAIPGSTAGLSIDPRGTTIVDLRVPTNLASTFGVRQPGATRRPMPRPSSSLAARLRRRPTCSHWESRCISC